MSAPSPSLVQRSTVDTAARQASWGLVIGLAALIGFGVGFQPFPRDPDLWFHLAGGRYMLAEGAVPQTDPFSFTRAGSLWVPHAWLFDVLVFTGWTQLGPRLTEACMAVAYAGIVLLGMHLLRRRGVAPVTALACVTLLAVAAGNTRGLRPQVLSLLLCALELVILTAHQARPSWHLAWRLPLLMLVWAQVHAACVMGLVVAAIWIGGRTLDRLLLSQNPPRRRELRPLLFGSVVAGLAVLCTPHAISHYAYVELTMHLQSLALTEEWQPPALGSLAVPDVYLTILVVGLLGLLATRRRSVGLAEAAVCAALAYLGSTGCRHIPLAYVGALPLAAQLLGRSDGFVPVKRMFGNVRWRRVIPAGVLLAAVCWSYPQAVWARYAAAEPVIGTRALLQMGGERNVFTTYNTGGYVLWSGPGQLRVFVDSRADVYGDRLVLTARKVQMARGWRAVFDRYCIDAAVIDVVDPLAAALAADDGWQRVADDAGRVTFMRASSLAHSYSTANHSATPSIPLGSVRLPGHVRLIQAGPHNRRF